MTSWCVGGSSTHIEDKPIILIRLMISNKHLDFIFNVMPTSSTHPTQLFSRVGQNIQFELFERMCFHTKEVMLSKIKQYHIDQSYKFVVVFQ